MSFVMFVNMQGDINSEELLRSVKSGLSSCGLVEKHDVHVVDQGLSRRGARLWEIQARSSSVVAIHNLVPASPDLGIPDERWLSFAPNRDSTRASKCLAAVSAASVANSAGKHVLDDSNVLRLGLQFEPSELLRILASFDSMTLVDLGEKMYQELVGVRQ